MMIGEYPCCGAMLMLAMPQHTPAFAKETCPNCGATVWHRFSRIDPESYTEATFALKFIVDESNHTITRWVAP